MSEKKFDTQVNYGWGLTLNMTGKAPAVSKRIFSTYKDALDYINDYNDSAIEGLTLSVINDTDELNGSYFVEKVGTQGDNNTYNNDGVLRKQVSSKDLNDIKQELDSFTIKKGSGTNSSLQVNAPGSDASGTNSFAVGMDAVASGDYSVAMGRACSATGRGSIALGGIIWIIRLTGEPNAVTYQTNIAYVKLAKYIVGLKLVDESDYTIHVATIIATNVVDDTVFITVDKTLSESALSSKPYGLLGCNASGNSSIALAGCIKALGNDSTAEGYYTVAAGNYSHAEGHRSISSGVTSHAEGRETEASADYSHTEGYRTMAEATASHAEGGATLASGDTAHAEGYGTVAAGNYSHAEGIGTIASGRDSHAEGYYTIATGKRSHAEGYAMHNIYLTGSNSTYQIRYGGNIQNTFHFIRRCQGASILEITNFTKIATITSVNISDDGYTVTITTDTDLGELSNYKCSALVTIASGEASHTENAAQSSGRDSHAGGWSLATNYCSFSHGVDCTADGEVSTSFGTNTYSQNNSEFALGRSNHSHTGETLAEQTLFSVGYGDFEQIDMSKRIEQQLPLPTPEDGTNALEIMQNGDIWLGGYEEGVKLFEGETKELNTYTKEELDIELDSKIDKNSISDTTGTSDTLIMSQKSITNAIADEKTRAEGVESALSSRLAVIEGEDEGSIKKVIADTKIYADTKIDELDSTKTGEGTFVDVTVSQENGVITSVTVAESDIASATILAEVKEDVDNFFKDASFVENAKDTLKELQEYITSDGEAALRMEQAIADNKTAIEAEVNRAKSAENGLNNAITSETTARETAVQDIQEDVDLINETIGEVADGKTLVEMIEAAEAAAIAAATVVAENSEFITIEQTGEVGKTQTYTIKTQDIASSSDLATEISRAQEAEQTNSNTINSIKSDYLKSSDKLELSQAIVSETEARIQAISNLEFKNSLKLDGVVQSEELLDTLPDVQSGALYSVGPDSNDRYKLYAYVNNSWTYMGYLNSSSIDITQSLGQSQNLAISQKAVTDALTPIIMTQAEFDALVSNGTITDDDLTIRYIID